MKDYYRILQVPRDAPLSVIRDAYRRLARSTHPDVSGGSPDTFREIQEAWETLGAAPQRHRYDQMLDASPAEQVSCEPTRANRANDARAPVSRTCHRQPVCWTDREYDLDILLEPHEAAGGLNVPLEIPVLRSCPSCGGRGAWFVGRCVACAGSGLEQHVVLLALSIGPGFRGVRWFEIPMASHGLRDVLIVRVRSELAD